MTNNTDSPMDNKPKPRLKDYLLPALVTFCALFALTFYLDHRPDYHASVSYDDKILWEIEGNSNSIVFTSITDTSSNNLDTAVWFKNNNNKLIKLGIIPDKGNKQSRRIELPQSLSVAIGSRLLISKASKKTGKMLNKPLQYHIQLTDINDE